MLLAMAACHGDHAHDHHHHGNETHEHVHHHQDHGDPDSLVDAFMALFKTCCPHSGNPHKKFVSLLMKKTRCDLVTDLFDQALRPLPHMAQAVASTLFISVVPIFAIYMMNIAFM